MHVFSGVKSVKIAIIRFPFPSDRKSLNTALLSLNYFLNKLFGVYIIFKKSFYSQISGMFARSAHIFAKLEEINDFLNKTIPTEREKLNFVFPQSTNVHLPL